MNISLTSKLRTIILVIAATGLASNEVHTGRLPRLPLMIFEHTGVAGHQSLARNHLAYCDLATDRRQGAYDIIREHHALTVSRVERRNSTPVPIRPWRLGAGVQYDCHHSPRREDGHRCHGPQVQALA